MDININYWAVLVSGIAAMGVGFIWYGPLFSKHWAKEMGWEKMSQADLAEIKKSANKNYPQQFVGALVMAYVLAHVLWAFEANTVSLGLQAVFWVWLGFIAPVKYGDTLWGGKSAKLFFIDALHYLVSLGVMSAILVSWK